MLHLLRPQVRLLAVVIVPLLCSACLAGPSTALGGGPIGRAPNLRETELLREPDSTRGEGFVIFSNRRDLLEESRVELNAAARSFQRLLGVRPEDADIRLVSDTREVQATIRVGSRPATSFTIALGLDRGRGRLPEATRVATVVVLASAREWLQGAIREFAPADPSTAGWMARTQVPTWLRTGILQNVAANPLHELWMVQLGRQRESLPSVEVLFGADACDERCLEPFVRIGSAGSATDGDAVISADDERPSPGAGLDLRRGRLPELEGRARYAASTYSLVQFVAKREGPAFMRALITVALAGGDVRAALGAARSFTAEPADIDRQWRVWLATFAYPEGR